MDEIICYTHYLSEGKEQNISFMELLLNDNWANGSISCPDTIFAEVGAKNTRLTAKQNYEFLLRAAKKYPIKAIGISAESSARISSSSDNISSSSYQNAWESFRTDCYIAAKYQQDLLDSGYFNPVMETLLTSAAQLSNPAEATLLLEKMVSHAPEYYEIDDNTRPILIYRGDSTCYNQLNVFADELAKALLNYHQRIEIFDVKKEGPPALTKYIGQHFKAIIGIQTYLFSVMMQDKKTNLHDLIVGPKYNFILDHPAWMKDHINAGPKDYYLLTHDRNYVDFSNRYFKKIKGCFYFTPAGTLPNPALAPTAEVVPANEAVPADNYSSPSLTEKLYGLSFIGTYYNYRNILNNLKAYDRKLRFFAARFLGEMKHHPNQPAEAAFYKIIDYYGLNLSDEEFLNLFYKTRHVSFCIMYYYREKIILTLLRSGIEINVYGDSWSKSPFATHPCLIMHPGLTPNENLAVMQHTEISLNIMAWHKDGFTERIANSMLCRSVVLSDRSTTLETEFITGKELVLYDLENIEMLPSLVKTLLNNPDKLNTIAQNGYEKAYTAHQWLHRGRQLLDIIEN